MNTLTLTKNNFIQMIPDIYKFIGSHSEVVLIPKTTKEMSAYEYTVSGKALKKSENDAIIKNRTQLKEYLHTLKK